MVHVGYLNDVNAKIRDLEAEIELLREALEFYADPSGKCERIPDFYDELCFGERASEALKQNDH
jgi:hypothetical protein